MQGTLLGKGRAAIVYRDEGPDGQALARKIFVGSGLADVVNQLLLGAANPYIWDQAAVEEAACRRRILTKLLSHWLPGKARVAPAFAAGWSEEHKAGALSTELIEGRAAALHHPFSADREWECRDLRDNVMAPLQAKLREAGLEGLLWQAGYGNPVALSNFLLERGRDGTQTWVWIDMESGVPALFPLSPRALFGFYLPSALRRGRPLFDDLDLERLAAYLAAEETALTASLGAAGLAELREDLAALGEIEGGWRGLRRLARSIAARLKRGAISAEEAAWYGERPLRWYGREVGRALQSLSRRLGQRLAAWFAAKRLLRFLSAARQFCSSARYRRDFARGYVAKRIEAWQGRRQLSDAEAAQLRRELDDDEASLYIVDFGVHIAIKPLVKSFTWLVLPTLFALGVIDEALLLFGIAATGAIARTLYTSARVLATLARGSPPPWIAFFVGLLPAIGNLAFPLQLLYAGAVKEVAVAKFLVYDLLTLLGSAAPVWGGQDSYVEHWFNHLGDVLVKARPALTAPQQPSAAPLRQPAE